MTKSPFRLEGALSFEVGSGVLLLQEVCGFDEQEIQFEVEGVAEIIDHLRRRFLNAALDLGDVAERHAGLLREITQGQFLMEALRLQGLPQHVAKKIHGTLPGMADDEMIVAEPRLYYKTDRVELWLGDAADVLRDYETERVELMVTDPPYGVEYVSGMRTESFEEIAGDGRDESSRQAVLEVLRDSLRLVRRNRHLYVFGPEVLASSGSKVSAPAELVWKKLDGPSMGNLASPWGTSHEMLYFYTNLFRHGGQRGAEKLPVRMRKGSVLEFVRPSGRKVRHPTEKPVPLLQELIESSSKVGEWVLDPYAGIGSTGVAALLSGRKAVLVEINEKYCEIAAERLKKAEQLWAAGLEL